MAIIAPLLCGLIFGAGLLISGMVQPTKVLGFLDIFGAWDPSLAVVMAGALAVSVPGFRLAGSNSRPWLAGQYFLPGKSGIDLPLVAGAALFGAGWGLVGLCPGPALESLATLSPGAIVFVVAMAAGMIAHDIWQQALLTAQGDRLASATDG
ncbi:DUF6691 family protein [Bradyrhizobium sp. CB3481]|uniref:DUF6691 family protein n=1 Tax=Bradyrhizobium sp. CB3481 TaxID=3039158 RepID=UPI0024B2839C|nr:DUF6691 family protein [Bradyrhizobium sp. CB3481]WFU18301.1 YeeE/YedE family protein [Bradyrhizobium sp. CB3481]